MRRERITCDRCGALIAESINWTPSGYTPFRVLILEGINPPIHELAVCRECVPAVLAACGFVAPTEAV